MIVSISFATVFTYALLWPGLIYVLGKCFGITQSFLYELCLAGYSSLLYLPFLLPCIVPSWLVALLCLIIPGLCKAVFMLRNHAALPGTEENNRKYIVYGFILLMEASFVLIVFFGIFNRAGDVPLVPTPPANATTAPPTARRHFHHHML